MGLMARFNDVDALVVGVEAFGVAQRSIAIECRKRLESRSWPSSLPVRTRQCRAIRRSWV